MTGSFTVGAALAVAVASEWARRRGQRREDQLRREAQDREDQRRFRDEQLSALADALAAFEAAGSRSLRDPDSAFVHAPGAPSLSEALSRVQVLFPTEIDQKAIVAVTALMNWIHVFGTGRKAAAEGKVPSGAEAVRASEEWVDALTEFRVAAKQFLGLPE